MNKSHAKKCKLHERTGEAVHRTSASAKTLWCLLWWSWSFLRNCKLFASCCKWVLHLVTGEVSMDILWNSTANNFLIPFTWTTDQVSNLKRMWDLGFCIWLLWSFAVEVGTDILLKQHSKLLSNTFHMNDRSSFYLEKNLIFDPLHLVAGEFSPSCWGVLLLWKLANIFLWNSIANYFQIPFIVSCGRIHIFPHRLSSFLRGAEYLAELLQQSCAKLKLLPGTAPCADL